LSLEEATPPQSAATPPQPASPSPTPVFAEAWQARAFALMLKLRERGHFTASEWSAALGRELQHAGDSIEYYQHWLTALESLVLSKGLTDQQALTDRKTAWADAYRRTPHGQPVELSDQIV